MLQHPVTCCELGHTLRSHDLLRSVTQFRQELKIATRKEGGSRVST